MANRYLNKIMGFKFNSIILIIVSVIVFVQFIVAESDLSGPQLSRNETDDTLTQRMQQSTIRQQVNLTTIGLESFKDAIMDLTSHLDVLKKYLVEAINKVIAASQSETNRLTPVEVIVAIFKEVKTSLGIEPEKNSYLIASIDPVLNYLIEHRADIDGFLNHTFPIPASSIKSNTRIWRKAFTSNLRSIINSCNDNVHCKSTALGQEVVKWCNRFVSILSTGTLDFYVLGLLRGRKVLEFIDVLDILIRQNKFLTGDSSILNLIHDLLNAEAEFGLDISPLWSTLEN